MGADAQTVFRKVSTPLGSLPQATYRSYLVQRLILFGNHVGPRRAAGRASGARTRRRSWQTRFALHRMVGIFERYLGQGRDSATTLFTNPDTRSPNDTR